jgi:Bacterial regulatory proteins, luxR family
VGGRATPSPASPTITDTTVKTQITHILQKLNLGDRVQAVVLAHETCLFAADAQPASRRDERPAR